MSSTLGRGPGAGLGSIASSVEWANSFADGVPRVRSPIPGPRSMALTARRDRYQFGEFPAIRQMPVAFVDGAGVTLTDADDNSYLDLTHGHMVAGLGHGNPTIARAIEQQARRLMNVRNFAVDVQVELMERLATVTPEDLNLFQFFSGGAEAMESALRIARAVTGGHEFLSFYGDYHGRTTGAIATAENGSRATGPRPGGFLTVPGGYCFRCEFGLVPDSCNRYCLEFAERAMRANSHGALAGIVAEPVTNGSGARVYPPGYLSMLRQIADRNGALLIFDEHATGLGRTGTWWAGDREGVTPDVMFFGKWLGNGFPITVVATRERYRNALSSSGHSSTFGGQPLACAAALATLGVIEGEDLVAHAGAVGTVCLQKMKVIGTRHRVVGDARGIGLLLAFELVDPATGAPAPETAMNVYIECLRRGVCVSVVGPTVRVSPMLVTSESVALRALDIVDEAIAEVEDGLSKW